VVLDQLELRVDRAVENVSERLGTIGFCGWRLFGVGAMLRSHRQGFFVGERSLLMCTGEEPLLRIESQLTLNIRPRRVRTRVMNSVVVRQFAKKINSFGPSVFHKCCGAIAEAS